MKCNKKNVGAYSYLWDFNNWKDRAAVYIPKKNFQAFDVYHTCCGKLLFQRKLCYGGHPSFPNLHLFQANTVFTIVFLISVDTNPQAPKRLSRVFRHITRY